MTPSMPPEALLITKNRTDSASDGIGGQVVILYFFLFYKRVLVDQQRFDVSMPNLPRQHRALNDFKREY